MPLQIMVFLCVAILMACSVNSTSNQLVDSESGWLVPQSKVRDGGPGPDGIPAIDNPVFVSVDQVSLDLDELVVGIKIGDQVRAYPHNILNWHEIVNDNFSESNESVSLSYCPLTGSSLLWQAFDESSDKTFGTSGLLYNTNLVLYDRETNSLWSQMLQQSINGNQISTRPIKLTAIETTWQTWKAMYPSSEILSEDTGFSRNYQRFLYGSYRSDNSVYFPVDNQDDRLHRKKRVLGFNSEKTSPYKDGTTHLIMTPQEFLQKLAALVPRPRLNLIRYHGVLAPNAKLRSQVVPKTIDENPTEVSIDDEFQLGKLKQYIAWARLLKRVFNIDIETCPY